MSKQRPISYDCRYYLGDRPCRFHKSEGALCECRRYDPVRGEILIIKLDAVGDVLRTTCLLPVIRRAWPGRRISWITRPSAAPLLSGNPYIDEILPYGPEALLHLGVRRFEKVICLDAGKTSASMASLARADDRLGFVMGEDGAVRATNPSAEGWLRLGLFDDLKRTNQRTYQQWMCDILGLPGEGLEYVLALDQGERQQAKRHLEELGVDPDRAIIGIHTGGGERWRLKQWHPERFAALVPRLAANGRGAHVVLFGGPAERDINRGIVQSAQAPVFDAGCDNSLRHFSALVSCCSVLVSGDSLAMHVALAVGCRVVVLFGPTSHAEIELFGRGEKVVPAMDCLVCYKQDCDFVPNCMDEISVAAVQQAVERQLERHADGFAPRRKGR